MNPGVCEAFAGSRGNARRTRAKVWNSNRLQQRGVFAGCLLADCRELSGDGERDAQASAISGIFRRGGCLLGVCWRRVRLIEWMGRGLANPFAGFARAELRKDQQFRMDKPLLEFETSGLSSKALSKGSDPHAAFRSRARLLDGYLTGRTSRPRRASNFNYLGARRYLTGT